MLKLLCNSVWLSTQLQLQTIVKLFINQQNGVYKQEEQFTQVHDSGQSQVQIEELKMLLTYNRKLLSAAKGFLRAPLLLSHSTHEDD